MFCDYAATSNDPWELAEGVKFAQGLWSNYFPNIKHTVKLKNNPIFFLVSPSYFHYCCLTFQSFNSKFIHGAMALQAIEVYFDQHPCFNDPEQRAAYVKWAVHKLTQKLDKFSRKFLVPPSEYPYMWANFDDDDPDHVVCISLFRQRLLSFSRSAKGSSSIHVFSILLHSI
ncbi:hypothetical protein SCLCIDRAFT_126054 [Scleroderma citrinum Foug A]|uniref:Uncharacterized protein n=1 Tax=Scleroderma citrinum Foug A TaxID=1036808 RepID=A0A0C3A454_9AGAM|nr:hypothetical protein SCLCIDRAFT_126054 [Scleroderma citrinum Foug A]